MKQVIKESSLEKGISEGKRIGLNCFTPTSPFLKNLEVVLRILLRYYEKSDLLPTIFGVVQELVNFNCVNNMRYIYYTEKNLSLESPEDFSKNEPDFLKAVSAQEKDIDFRKKLVEQNMNVLTVIDHNDVGVTIKVFNQAKTQLNQETYVRDYLRKAMQYQDVNDYYRDHPEDTHGKNIGLALSIIILKEAGLRPDLMRFGKTGTEGHSRIEIPFVSDYKSIRDRILNDESIVPFEKPNLIPPQFREQFEARRKQLGSENKP